MGVNEIKDRAFFENTDYKKYENDDLEVYYSKTVCEHAGKCTKGDPEVFEVGRKPWIMPELDSSKNITKTIDNCPSGALKYVKK